MTLTQASKHLKISPSTLRHAAEKEIIPVLHPLPDGPWIFSRATSTAKRPRNSSIAHADGRKNGACAIARPAEPWISSNIAS